MECRKCGWTFGFVDDEVKYDEYGYGYTTKYVICPRCKSVCVVDYIEDECLDVNNDERYYVY